MTVLKLLSYNVRSLRDDTAALARVIREIEPDVAIIQEAPRFLRWRTQCAALARRSGMVLVTGGRASGANLVMSTLGVEVKSTHEVAFSPDPHLHRRGAAVASLALSGKAFAVAGTHLDLVEAPRLRHLDELAAVTTDLGVPLIVGGDLNAAPGSATWQRLLEFGADAFAEVGSGDGLTYSSTDPVRRIDGLFADARLTPVSATVLDTPDTRLATDHRPLVVEFDLG